MTIFLLIALGGVIVSAVIIGPKRVLNPRHFALLFLVMMSLSYVVRPLLVMAAGTGFTLFEAYAPGISVRIVEDFNAMALLFSASLLFFALGYRALSRPEIDHRLLAATRSDNRAELLRKVGLLLIVIGYLSFPIAQRSFIGESVSVDYVFSDGGTGYANTTGYLELANYFVVSGAFVYYAVSMRLGLVFLLSLPWALSQVSYGWGRMMILVWVIGLLAIWLVRSPINSVYRKQFGALAFGILITVLLTFAMRSNRAFLLEGEPLESVARSTLELPVDQAIGDFSGFEGTWLTYASMDIQSPRYGTGLIYQFLVKPVPRILWRSKPFPGDFTWQNIAAGFGYSVQSRSSTPDLGFQLSRFSTGLVRGSIGDALYEWGWAGIAVNFFLTGLFYGWVERRYALSGGALIWVSTYAATYGMLVMMGRNYIFANQSTVFLLVFYGPYFLINLWSSRMSRRAKRRNRLRKSLSANTSYD